MTKLQMHFRLQRPLDDALLARIAEAHGVYGILRITVDPASDGITVEFDATRLHLPDVGATLASLGIPALPVE